MKLGDQPAFPIPFEIAKRIDEGYGFEKIHLGLTKREYFAGLAMQGMMANPSFYDWDAIRIAKESIVTADELLKQLSANDSNS